MLRPGQKRASAPKVRSGCLTCKARRVKCDELRPACTKCTKSRRNCEYKRKVTQTTTRALAPITSSATNVSPPAGIVKTPTQILSFIDNREPQYFRTYQDEVSRELAAALRISPWVSSVLQACHTEPSILRFVVAIGALNKSFKLAHFASHGPTAMKDMTLRAAASHREYALCSYTKALTGMKAISRAPLTPSALRHFLIGCLLIHCMEVFLQSPGTAFEHSTVGYNLLLNYIASNLSMTRSYKWICSPNTAIIEDAVFHEYTRLQNDRALSAYSPPLSHHQQCRQIGASTIQSMPSRFTTLEEAQDYQELIEQRTSHLIAEIRATSKQAHVLLAHPLASDLPGHIVDPCSIPHLNHLLPIRDAYLVELNAWRDSFAPIHSQLSLSPDTRLAVGSAVQQTRALNSIISLSTILSPSETCYDSFYAAHAEILALITRSIKVTPHVCNDLRPVFQLSSTFHRPIANLAVSCRDKAVREQAIAIMIRLSPRDGDMERSRRVFSHKYLIAMEELNRNDDGNLPAHLRYRIMSTHTHGSEEAFTVVVARQISDGPHADLYPSQKGYRWRTWKREEAEKFIVGDLVADCDEEGVEREREEEIKKWPKGVEKPAWIRWWEVFRQLKEKAQQMRERQEMMTGKPSAEADWSDINDFGQANAEREVLKVALSTKPHVVIEQIGGFGAWVAGLNIHGDQDLAAIQRDFY